MRDMNMNLAEAMKGFSDESECRAYLEALRWPNSIHCPSCKHDKTYRLTNRALFLCASCEYQFSVTANTIFHDTHLPLVTWFLATVLLCEAKNGISACQIQRSLGIKTYKTAWYLCHRIRAAMVDVNRTTLNGAVEGRVRGVANKEVVIGIRPQQRELRFFHAEDVRSGILEKYIRENIADDVEVLMTDDFNLYEGARKRAGVTREKHKTIRHQSRIYVQRDTRTNTAESASNSPKRGVIGTWHKVSAKHLHAYCHEICFRFNNRKNPYLFRDTILKLIASPNLEYKKLTENQNTA